MTTAEPFLLAKGDPVCVQNLLFRQKISMPTSGKQLTEACHVACQPAPMFVSIRQVVLQHQICSDSQDT